MGDIFIACKRGDLERVTTLVEEMQCEINVTDKWNSTPLYYACLLGYQDIVHFLLQSGAKYNIDKFHGERCINSALTDQIRAILKNPPVEKPGPTRNPFRDAMGHMLTEAYLTYSDVTLNIGGTRLSSHKCILAANSPYFLSVLHGRDKHVITFKHYKELCVGAWIEILRYIYTQNAVIHRHMYKDCLHLSRRLGLKELTAELRQGLPLLSKRGTEKIEIKHPVRCYYEISEIALASTTEESRKPRQQFADLCVKVGNRKFYCHKAFLVSHSPYFAALLDNEQFTEVKSSNRGNLTFITLKDVGEETFSTILGYIYTGKAKVTNENLHDLLYYADHYMIPGLKLLCGEHLETEITTQNAIQILSLARMLRMTKLQHSALRHVAQSFEQLHESVQLRDLLLHDEQSLRGRRRVRVSESSLDEEAEAEEDDENGQIAEVQCVDIQMDLRLYLREITNTHGHTPASQQREEFCVGKIEQILRSLPST